MVPRRLNLRLYEISLRGRFHRDFLFYKVFKEKENKNKENEVIKFKGENRVIAGGINCPPTTLRTKRN